MCPKCKEQIDIEHDSWGGDGEGHFEIGCECKKCGHMWKEISDIKFKGEK